MKRLLLVTGSRVLDNSDTPREWGKQVLRNAISRLDSGDVILSGGARGPDTWAVEEAARRGVRRVELKLNGVRYENGEPTKLWCREDPKKKDPSKFPLERNEALIDTALAAMKAGWQARVLALVSSASSTHGTAFTVSLAEAKGLTVTQRTFEREIDTRPDVVWLDIETGGRSHELHPILEIGAIRVDPSHKIVRDRFEMKISPAGKRVEPDAAAVNGYSETLWLGAALPHVAFHAFLNWLPSSFIVGGFNVSFDIRFLKHHFNLHSVPEPGWRPNPLDPMHIAKNSLRRTGRVPNVKLDTLCDYFGIPNDVSHRALADADRARLVYHALLGHEAQSSVFEGGKVANV